MEVDEMHREEFSTGGKVARTSKENLWGEARHPAGGSQMVEFEQEIIWVEETESEVLFLHGGEEVGAFGKYTDFYGYGTSFCGANGAVAAAKQLAEKFGVTADSSAEIVVKVTTFQEPAVRATSEDARKQNAKADENPNWKRKFARVPEGWRTRREVDDIDGKKHFMYPRLERQVLTEETVWSIGAGMSRFVNSG